ncbi:MAG: MFS transporter [Anaerolineae bacterium]|nr:MFS transporter [Phycisphaerae bacterium]
MSSPEDQRAARNANEDSQILAYEAPDGERASSASPTEQQLEREAPSIPQLDYSPTRTRDPYAALRIRNYRLYAAAFWMGVIGGQTQNVAVGWEIYKKTNSALSLGWLGLAMATPVLLLALPAGHVADTHSRRRIMLVTHTISAMCALALAMLSYFWANVPHSVLGIYALMIFGNAGATFGRPARSALMPQLVPPSVFPNAVTWNSTIFEIASVVGPMFGGIICGFSIPVAYLFAAICWSITIVLVWLLPNKQPPQRGDGSVPRFADLIAGVRFVFQNKMMLGAMTLDMFAVLLGGCTFLLPIFAKDLGGGALAFGLLRSAPSIGAIVMALVIAHTPPFQRAGRALLLAVAGFGVVTLIFGISHNFALSFSMLVLMGAFDNISVVIRHTLIQLLTPDRMRGRVSAVNQVFIGSSNEIGGLESGLVAAWLGHRAAVVIGGVGTILVVIAVGAIWPQVRKLTTLADVKPEASQPRPRKLAAVPFA